ncbi:MAG: 2-amino-4-hydroxy-6-hydroxymethyldihydropteridine diphosphokinase [Calditrichaeota bacterium]|nr:MAG: 2-amino-4-hydroxy-6-hydroxymethyldihydropteridine diphosphokinase [Calditrichota bacterium]
MSSGLKVKPVYLALGSNVEPRREYLITAVQALEKLGQVTAVAPIYESPPYGYQDQGDFYNSACLFLTTLPPLELLVQLKQIEKALGRVPRVRWGPREIDLDIIFYDRMVLHSPDLTIPHADYIHRPFVLRPLADLAPEFVPPDQQEPLCCLAQRFSHDALRLVEKNWIAHGIKL